jgi:DNA-directed RNA polymerase specialized sigma24 family protein
MMKADLDMAIARLPMHLRMVALVYWVRGYSDAEAVGRMLRLSTRQIFRHLNQARERMVSHLCENQCQ